MLQIISGIPGSSKTLYATALAVKYMKKGRPVFSNYPISYKKRGEIYTSYKLTKNMLREKSFPVGSVLFIDEAQMWFGSREWKEFKKEDLLLFSQHRHFGYEMYLITQHPARLDTVIREIANIFWILDRYKLFTVATGYYEYAHLDSLSDKVRKKRKILLGLSRYYRCYDTFYGAKFKNTSIESYSKWSKFRGKNYNIQRIVDMFNKIKNKFDKKS